MPPHRLIQRITVDCAALRQSVTACLEHKNRSCDKNPMCFKITLRKITRKCAFIPAVRAIDNFVYMMTSSKWRPGTILEKLYPPQNFVPAFWSTVVWSLESQFPWKRTDRASIQSNQKWRRLQCVEEFCIRSRTAGPKLSSERLTCYKAKGNLR